MRFPWGKPAACTEHGPFAMALADANLLETGEVLGTR